MEPLPFGELLKQKKLKPVPFEDEEEEEDPTGIMLVYIFDVLEIDGKGLLMEPLEERRKHLPSL